MRDVFDDIVGGSFMDATGFLRDQPSLFAVQPKNEDTIPDLWDRVRNRLRVYDYVRANTPEVKP